jgi:hypothetical protein
MVDYAARLGAGTWLQTAFWAITPVKSFRLYRECTGTVKSPSLPEIVAAREAL